MSCVLDARFSELSTPSSNPPPPYSTTSSSFESNRIAHHGRSISASEERTVQKRPLPPPPSQQLRSSSSTPSLTSLSRQNTRPLPSLPESRPPPPVPNTAPPTVSEQPVMYYLASSPPPPLNRASAPVPVRNNTVRTRPKAISLQTRSEALKPKTTIPPVPEPPTPVTALKKRSAKLKNFYGDAPPTALLVQQHQNDRTVPPSAFASTGRTALPPSQRSSKHELTRAEAAEIARQLKQFELDDLWQGRQLQTPDSDDDSSSDEEDEELIKSCGNEPFLVKGVVFDAVNVAKVSKRWSRRWILETKGRKSEVQDYSLVLKALREL